MGMIIILPSSYGYFEDLKQLMAVCIKFLEQILAHRKYSANVCYYSRARKYILNVDLNCNSED